MKLIDLKRGDKFTVDDPEWSDVGTITFGHLDGMYSVHYIDKTNELIHLHFATPIIKESTQ